MLGKNLKLPPDHYNSGLLKINSIFATFQGEGFYTGSPALFIRLSGCNLACKFCDTEFDYYQIMEIEEIIDRVKKMSLVNNIRNPNLVVITGGEPMRQNIVALCERLVKDSFLVQIETNGTIFQNLPEEIYITCSPKTSNGKHYGIDKRILTRVSSFKFLVSAGDKNYSDIPDLGQDRLKIPTYLQPMDEYEKTKNKANIDLTLELARKYGYRISLQTHKVWGIE